MAATFIVETGEGLSTANSLMSVADADQIIENFGDSTDWSGATTAEKEAALRQATRYLDLHYSWAGYKIDADQALQWPRFSTYDEDGNAIDSDAIPSRVEQACAYLAVKNIEGDILLEDFDNESKVKKTKDVIGPITEEREYVHGEDPDKTYQTVDRLVSPFVYGEADDSFNSTDLVRA